MKWESLVNLPGFGESFMTRGCPDCNRPYYNERPGGPMYNYPFPLGTGEAERALKEALSYFEVNASGP
jgi:biotin synthase